MPNRARSYVVSPAGEDAIRIAELEECNRRLIAYAERLRAMCEELMDAVYSLPALDRDKRVGIATMALRAAMKVKVESVPEEPIELERDFGDD